MRIRALIATLSTLVAALAVAAPAMASGAGEGLAGETDDKVVTIFCLFVLLFFVSVVFIGTFIQNRLEKRKDARKAAKMRQRVGW